jgi:hypothetical protein
MEVTDHDDRLSIRMLRFATSISSSALNVLSSTTPHLVC